jgi:peptidoglycan LD-endopeptidase LytH
MPALRNAIVVCALTAGCSAGAADQATSTTSATSAPSTTVVATTAVVVPTSSTAPVTSPATTTIATRPLVYVFPFTGKKVSYAHTHHDYPASDVFGCGANVVAPIGGVIEQTRTFDPWVPKVNDPATRGGKYVSMLGDDGVRYYFAHLDSVAVQPADVVDAGAPLGIMGQTGDARNSACHTHVGISWPCPTTEWAVRRGEIWPWRYLDAWRTGQQLSPVDEIKAAEAANPDACNLAGLATSAADA